MCMCQSGQRFPSQSLICLICLACAVCWNCQSNLLQTSSVKMKVDQEYGTFCATTMKYTQSYTQKYNNNRCSAPDWQNAMLLNPNSPYKNVQARLSRFSFYSVCRGVSDDSNKDMNQPIS